MNRNVIPFLAAVFAATVPAGAEDLRLRDLPRLQDPSLPGLPIIDAGRSTILIHGNYCGPGNRAPLSPVDALDRACMHHDECSPPRGKIASCACNDRLNREAALIADDPGEPEAVRDTAEFIAGTALALPCR